MKLTLHVGLGKTGTSAVQAFLHHERRNLAEAGILSLGPRLAELEDGFSFSGQGDVGKIDLLAEGLSAIENAAIGQPHITHVVWSNEALSMAHNYAGIIDEIARFRQASTVFDEVGVILVLRRQDEWLASAYLQWGLKHKMHKGRRILSVADYMKSIKGFLDYFALYQAWSRAGNTPVVIGDYGEIVRAGGMVRFMADYLSLPWKESYGQYDRVHPSLGPAQSYLNATYNSAFYGDVLPAEFESVIRDLDLPEISPKGSSFIPESLGKEIVDQYAEGNRKLSMAALGDASLFQSAVAKEVVEYRRGEQDVIRYLTMIAQRQNARINALQNELRETRERLAAIDERLARGTR